MSSTDSTKNSNGIKRRNVNPNTATLNELLDIGFTQKQAKNLEKFRAAGGKFYNIRDLLKLYTIKNDDFERLQHFLFIPDVAQTQKFENKKNNGFIRTEHKILDLNSCDSIQLTSIPFIGKFRAKKIIEFREKAGGFYSVNQLLGIYSVDSSVFETIKDNFIVDTSKILKINVNTATFKEINNHPLISYYQTKNIMDYKKIVKNIVSIRDLEKNNILKKDEFDIIKHYIKTF